MNDEEYIVKFKFKVVFLLENYKWNPQFNIQIKCKSGVFGLRASRLNSMQIAFTKYTCSNKLQINANLLNKSECENVYWFSGWLLHATYCMLHAVWWPGVCMYAIVLAPDHFTIGCKMHSFIPISIWTWIVFANIAILPFVYFLRCRINSEFYIHLQQNPLISFRRPHLCVCVCVCIRYLVWKSSHWLRFTSAMYITWVGTNFVWIKFSMK